jgi:hypothetical protein
MSVEDNEQTEMSKRALWLEQTSALYARLGRYLVDYGQFIFMLRRCLFVRLVPGQAIKEEAALVVDELSDRALVRAVERLVRYVRSPDEREELIVRDVFARIRRAIERRDQIIHSTWYVGWGNEYTQRWDTAEREKRQGGSRGGKILNETFDDSKLRADLVELFRTHEVAERLLMLALYPLSDERPSIVANFTAAPGKNGYESVSPKDLPPGI